MRVASGDEFDDTFEDFVVVQYWLFYVFNDGGNNHEGDWEGIQLIFDGSLADIVSGATPRWLYYAHHGGGTMWSDCGSEWTGRPDVYVALGSHASFRKAGEYETEVPLLGDLFDDDANGKGKVLRPEDYEVRLLGDQSWLAWLGNWGALGIHPDVSGPTGPSTKTRWTKATADWTVKWCE